MKTDRWFAIRVKSNREHICARSLEGRGYEVFLPHHRHTTVARKKAMTPLFPGYVFCRLDCERRLPVLTVPGVVHIVGIGKKPHPIEDSELEALRALVRAGFPFDTSTPYTVGTKVRINWGPLSGIEGIIAGTKAGSKVEKLFIVSITLLQRSVAVAIPDSWMQLVAPTAPIALTHHS